MLPYITYSSKPSPSPIALIGCNFFLKFCGSLVIISFVSHLFCFQLIYASAQRLPLVNQRPPHQNLRYQLIKRRSLTRTNNYCCTICLWYICFKTIQAWVGNVINNASPHVVVVLQPLSLLQFSWLTVPSYNLILAPVQSCKATKR